MTVKRFDLSSGCEQVSPTGRFVLASDHEVVATRLVEVENDRNRLLQQHYDAREAIALRKLAAEVERKALEGERKALEGWDRYYALREQCGTDLNARVDSLTEQIAEAVGLLREVLDRGGPHAMDDGIDLLERIAGFLQAQKGSPGVCC